MEPRSSGRLLSCSAILGALPAVWRPERRLLNQAFFRKLYVDGPEVRNDLLAAPFDELLYFRTQPLYRRERPRGALVGTSGGPSSGPSAGQTALAGERSSRAAMVELMGDYSRHHCVLETLRSVRALLATERLAGPVKQCPLVRRHKLTQRLSPETITQLLTDYQAGSCTVAVAKRYKISKTSVKTLLHSHGIPLRGGPHLSESDVLAAAELYQAGWSLVRIGRQLGVDGETVRRRLRQIGVQMRGPHERSRS